MTQSKFKFMGKSKFRVNRVTAAPRFYAALLLLLNLHLLPAADVQLQALPESSTAAATSIVWVKIPPFGAAADRKMTLGSISVHVLGNLDAELLALAAMPSTSATAYRDGAPFGISLLTGTTAAHTRLLIGAGTGSGNQAFANDAARAAAAPEFVSQLGVQTDTLSLWRGVSTAAGDWSANWVVANLTADIGFSSQSLQLTGTVGNSFVDTAYQSAAPSTPAANHLRIYGDATGRISWIKPDGFTRTFDGAANTASRVYSLPDASITIAGTNLAQTFTGTQSFSGLLQTSTIANSANSSAGTPAMTINGAWFSGGSATTTRPMLVIEPAGTTSAAWSTSGTGLGVNAASGFTGHLLSLQLAGVSRLFLTSSGNATLAGGVTAAQLQTTGDTGYLGFGAKAYIQGNAADGTITLFNNAGTGFSQLNFGGTGSAAPALRVLNQSLVARNGNNTADTGLVTGTLKVGGTTASAIALIVSGTAAMNFASMAAGLEDVQTLTVTGAATTSIPTVSLGWSAALEAGIVVKQAWVSAADTVSIRVLNANTVTTVDPAAVNVRATVISY